MTEPKTETSASRGGKGPTVRVGADGLSPLARPWLWLMLLVVYGLVVGLVGVGLPPLGSHEALAAQRSKEMMEAGNWAVPRLFGVEDVRKPPLAFWVNMAVAKVAGGISEWTVRLPSVAASLATMLLLVAWGRRLRGWRTGLLAGFAWMTSMAGLYYGRRAEVDMQFCLWTTAAMLSFWAGMRAETLRGRWGWLMLAWASLGITILAKGPTALAMFVLVAMAWWAVVVLLRDPRPHLGFMGILPVAVAPLVIVALSVPWVLAVIAKVPNAWDIWYSQSGGRYAGELGHSKDPLFYLYETPLLWLPWLVPMVMGIVLAIRRRAVERSAWLLVIVWTAMGISFLSFGEGKRLHYALIFAPAMFLLIGVGLEHLVWGLTQRLDGWQKSLAWAHLAAIPGVLSGGIALAIMYPATRAGSIGMGVAGSAGFAVVMWLYLTGRRAASVPAFAVTAAVVVAVASVWVVPPIVSQEAEVQIGRYVRGLPADAKVGYYLDTDAVIRYYADRPMAVLLSPDTLAPWSESAGNYIVTKKDHARDELLPTGKWELVEMEREGHGRGAYRVLRSRGNADGNVAAEPAETK